MCTLVLPQALRGLAGGAKQLDVAGATVADVLDTLAAAHPVLARRIRDEQGRLRRYVNVYVDGSDVRHCGGLAAAVTPNSELLVLPSVAGG
jgi:molybdopterin converting factor small subunit